MAAIPASNARDLRLRNVRTGQEVEVDQSILETKDSSVVRQLAAEVEPLMHNADISVDWEKKSYSFTSYPSLWLFNKWYYVVVGAFLVAACSQLQFLFPCGIDYSPVTWGAAGTKYCVPTADLGRVTQASCPLDICSKRIPVTMQTFAVLLNGAIAGPSGWMATALYVVMVCVGAPFGSNGKFDPVWNKGAIVGASYFIGFIFASFIMGKCASKGHDRLKSAYYMIPWLLAAELAIYAWGLFWMPFGMAIVKGVSPSEICPSSAGAGPCLKNIFNWGLVPFIPGELIKMFFVILVVPAAWQIALIWHRWRVAVRQRYGDGASAAFQRGVAAPSTASESGDSDSCDSTSPKAGKVVDSSTISVGVTLQRLEAGSA